MDLKLLKEANAEKGLLSVWVYEHTLKKLHAICETEKIHFPDLVRHLVNKFLEEYTSSKVS